MAPSIIAYHTETRHRKDAHLTCGVDIDAGSVLWGCMQSDLGTRGLAECSRMVTVFHGGAWPVHGVSRSDQGCARSVPGWVQGCEGVCSVHGCSRLFTEFHGLSTEFHGLFTVVSRGVHGWMCRVFTGSRGCAECSRMFTVIHGVSRPVHGVSRFVHGCSRLFTGCSRLDKAGCGTVREVHNELAGGHAYTPGTRMHPVNGIGGAPQYER